jgi:transposase
MRPQRPISDEAKESLQRLLLTTKSKTNFQRVQAVWLRAALGLSSKQVALSIGWSPATVKKNWSQYFSQGEKALLGEGRGGRRRENFSLKEETVFLGRFFETAKDGGVLVVNEVKAAYEEELGRTVPKSTVYRMLARHGWRKISPRPRHPKFNEEKIEAFKKTPRDRS